jgi:predicted phage terminase large subunit-like protein
MAQVTSNMSPSETNKLRKARWLGRTNLLWLCNEVLGFKDVCEEVHGPLVDAVQKFPLPSPEIMKSVDLVVPGKVQYIPWMNPYRLEGKRRMLLLDPRGGLKCLRKADVRKTIRLSNGSYKAAQDVRPGDFIEATQTEYSLLPAWTQVSAVEEQPAQECYRIKFQSGRVLEISENHPLRFIDTWVRAKDVKIGARIAVRALVQEPSKPNALPNAELIGWMLGDGSLGCCQITNGKRKFIDRIAQLAAEGGFTTRIGQDSRTGAYNITLRGSQHFWNELGLRTSASEYERSATKFVPDIVFTASNADVAKVLYGLFMSDGTATTAGIFLTSKSEQLCKDVQHLLARFGIWSVVKPHQVGYNGQHFTFWTVRIKAVKHVKRFVEVVGWDKLWSYDLARKANANIDTIPKTWRKAYGKYLWKRGTKPLLPTNKSFVKYDITKERLAPIAEALGDLNLQYLCQPDIVWDTVEAVEYIGCEPTIAIQTSAQTFNVSDVITHNTSINCVAHTIQWILNFPHLAYLVVQANTQKAEDILREIKQHFQYNSLFRSIYPDYCPQRRVTDWGNRQEFDVPDEVGRGRLLEESAKAGFSSIRTRREHTCMTASIDKGTAGYHWDVMKFSDIVEENNTRTEDQVKQVTYTFNMMENLLVMPSSWIDVEGTRYANGDLYGVILDRWSENKLVRDQWHVHIRSCYKRDFKGEEEKFTPDSLRYPFLYGEDNKPISWWPARMPVDQLEAKRATDPYVFTTQQLNDPVGMDDDTKMFPLKIMRWMDPKEFAKVPISHYTTTVDTADTVGVRSNNSCITTCAWDKFGRCYVIDVRLGKMLPDALAEAIIQVYKRFKPQNVIVEETMFVRGFKPTLKRRMDLEGYLMPLTFIKRDNQVTKKERILNTLQPWYKAKEIVFLENLDDKDHIVKELDRFPTWDDDFLDTLADQFQGRDWFGRLNARPKTKEELAYYFNQERDKELNRYFKIESAFTDEDSDYMIPVPGAHSEARSRTGGL